MTGGGKSSLYAVPLQHEFDLTPLAPDALEFLHTPKEQCKICKVVYPLQILALHIQQCEKTPSSDDDYDEVNQFYLFNLLFCMVKFSCPVPIYID